MGQIDTWMADGHKIPALWPIDNLQFTDDGRQYKKQHKKKKRKEKKTVTTVTKHVEKYLTTQFQTQPMNIDYTALQNALSHALYLVEKCSLRRARITLGNTKANSF